jgi:Xaa-Pro aminopeptidase
VARDAERVERVVDALREAGCDALACALPANVLLLTGYWSVIGSAIALATRDGRVALLVPADERELAECGWADDLHTFEPGGLEQLRSVASAAAEPLAALARALGLADIGGRVAYERGGTSEPASYVALHLYGAGMHPLLRHALPRAKLVDGSEMLWRLRAVKTPLEIHKIAGACAVAERAFQSGAVHVVANATERSVAAAFAAGLEREACGDERSGGYAFCMSGPNSAAAGAAYARSRDRALCQGEVALVHCNSHVGGFWTDITRTYCTGAPGEQGALMYDAVFAARAAALAAIRPGARGSDVDHAARAVLEERSFGRAFTHGTGHGVGFAAIDHGARPRLHPASADILETGMVFNVEPAVYLPGVAGVRHCDVVALSGSGTTVLTPFHDTLGELLIG